VKFTLVTRLAVFMHIGLVKVDMHNNVEQTSVTTSVYKHKLL